MRIKELFFFGKPEDEDVCKLKYYDGEEAWRHEGVSRMDCIIPKGKEETVCGFLTPNQCIFLSFHHQIPPMFLCLKFNTKSSAERIYHYFYDPLNKKTRIYEKPYIMIGNCILLSKPYPREL